MSKITSTKKFLKEDFPVEIRSWIDKLIAPLNSFLEQVYFALVNGLTLKDNLKCQVDEFTLEKAVSTQKYTWRLNERPTEVRLAHITETGGSPGVIPVHSMQWLFNENTVYLTFSGLETTKSYRIRIIGQV